MVKQILRMLNIGMAGMMLALGLATVLTPAVQASEAKDAICEGIGAATNGTGCEDSADESNVENTVKNVVNILSLVVAVIAVIMVIVGGLKYVVSQGESAGTSSAKNTVIYAIIGLIIVALAQILVRFVVYRTTENPRISSPVENTETPSNVGGGNDFQ